MDDMMKEIKTLGDDLRKEEENSKMITKKMNDKEEKHNKEQLQWKLV